MWTSIAHTGNIAHKTKQLSQKNWMQEPFYSYSSVSYKKEQPFPPLHARSEKGNDVRHVNIKLYNRCCFCDTLFIGNFIRLPTENSQNGMKIQGSRYM